MTSGVSLTLVRARSVDAARASPDFAGDQAGAANAF